MGIADQIRKEYRDARSKLDRQARWAVQGRLRQGDTLAQIARDVDMDRSNLTAWWRGRSGRIGLDRLESLARSIGGIYPFGPDRL